jgi:hypothetical protein
LYDHSIVALFTLLSNERQGHTSAASTTSFPAAASSTSFLPAAACSAVVAGPCNYHRRFDLTLAGLDEAETMSVRCHNLLASSAYTSHCELAVSAVATSCADPRVLWIVPSVRWASPTLVATSCADLIVLWALPRQ